MFEKVGTDWGWGCVKKQRQSRLYSSILQVCLDIGLSRRTLKHVNYSRLQKRAALFHSSSGNVIVHLFPSKVRVSFHSSPCEPGLADSCFLGSVG